MAANTVTAPMRVGKLRFAIDRGGTFTDVYAEADSLDQPGKIGFSTTLKLLSEDPRHYDSAPREGIRRILEEVTGQKVPRSVPVPHENIESIRMGTTVATNALLERKGARMALLVTKGFKDLLQIGNQSRPRIFDLRVEKPDNLYETVLEVDERLILSSPAGLENGEDGILPQHKDKATGKPFLKEVTGTTGEKLLVEKEPDLASLRVSLQAILDSGIRAVAIVFMHSYAYPNHEISVGTLAKEMGFEQVSLSSEVMPMVKIIPRGFTASADAYLTPHTRAYINSFAKGFENQLKSTPDKHCDTQLSFMQSDGGLTPVEYFSGHRAILSGPAGGVVGYALTTWNAQKVKKAPIVAFDMGGTSTDVSRFDGRYEHVFECSIAGITIQAPQLDISTVAAGGGSRLFFRSGLFAVGPESAGAHPGPVCYRKGGYLAVTDANLQLGRIVPESFPHIFGPTEDQPLDVDATREAFAKLGEEVNAFYSKEEGSKSSKSVDEIAFGFLQVANEAMCRPIRALTQMRGFDLTTHTLACFGGAGPQHACAIAKALGMKRIFISRYSGILSAYGISLADVVAEAQQPLAGDLLAPHESAEKAVLAALSPAQQASITPTDLAFACSEPEHIASAISTSMAGKLQTLAAEVADRLLGQRFTGNQIIFELFANLRYKGTDTAIMVPCFVDRDEKDGGAGADDGAVASLAPNQLTLASILGAGYTAGSFNASSPSFDSLCQSIDAGIKASVKRFLKAYQREFGFVLQHRDVLCDDVRVRGIARGRSLPEPDKNKKPVPADTPLPAPVYVKSVFFGGVNSSPPSVDGHNARPTDAINGSTTVGGRVQTPIYALSSLQYGQTVAGPAMLIDKTSTIVIEPGFKAGITVGGDVEIEAIEEEAAAESTSKAAGEDEASTTDELSAADPIQLSIFSHRFMGIAEQMGRTLQRTSISVNMRERLDYSCALFAPDGGLVANAPHIPVHLGAMGEAVKFQMKYWHSDACPADQRGLKEGDVLVSNHPQLAGGSHLPDITVITPVFNNGKIVFFVASRGHHADIGGIAPGSMPPNSKSLKEEGAAIVAFKLVRNGEFQEAGITELLMAPGKNGVPGCSGSRNLKDCLSDLKAQVAANHKGIQLVSELIAEYSLRTVTFYMRAIQKNAEFSVREMLVRFSHARGLPEVGTVRAVDFLDDGTAIALAITVDRKRRCAKFDFTGTGSEVYGNTNAPNAVTYSAIIYSLRCLVGVDVPLNQGCLAPIEIVIPEGTILHPSPEAAVVGGNVLTSQRVVDVILKAFGACGASQGCMNNLTMGNDHFGFYETIAGGSGAGPGWNGRSGTQSHMTNTRATDPEIFERRYPVVQRANTLRQGSGGSGKYTGGEGVLRAIQFRIPLTVSILSERRAFRPYGLSGGGPGARGVNTLVKGGAGGRAINLAGKATVNVEAGDLLQIETPGGGGYGAPETTTEKDNNSALVVALAEELKADEEYSRAYLAATGTLPPAIDGVSTAKAALTASVDVIGGASAGAGKDPKLFPFSGSVGNYKETQETN